MSEQSLTQSKRSPNGSKGAVQADPFVAHFARLEASLNGSRNSWLHGVRQAGMAQYVKQGLPTRKLEEWRFTNVAPLANTTFHPAFETDAPAVSKDQVEALCPELNGSRLVFVNGRLDKNLSKVDKLPKGAIVSSMAEAVESNRELVEAHLGKPMAADTFPFLALNTAFISDGAFVYAPKGTKIEGTLQLVFLTASTSSSEPLVSHPRNLIVAQEQAELSILEYYVGLQDEVYFTNAVTECVLGASASVEHVRVQQESRKAYHTASVNVIQGKDSTFANHAVILGGQLTRNDINAVLDASGIHATLNGFYLADGTQLVDNHTRVEHAKPHCNSWEVYKGVLGGKARGVFSGTIHVHQDAQKTDAKQSNKNLLISDDARVNTKPQLRIYADDVKCTHGATIGRLDEDALYYLRCRGLDHSEARRMLTHAFAGEVIDGLKDESIRFWVAGLVRERMSEMKGMR